MKSAAPVDTPADRVNLNLTAAITGLAVSHCRPGGRCGACAGCIAAGGYSVDRQLYLQKPVGAAGAVGWAHVLENPGDAAADSGCKGHGLALSVRGRPVLKPAKDSNRMALEQRRKSAVPRWLPRCRGPFRIEGDRIMMEGRGRILAVDPGEIADWSGVSDPTQTIASPWQLSTMSRAVGRGANRSNRGRSCCRKDYRRLPAGCEGCRVRRRAGQNAAEAIRTQTDLPVELWDESGSTQAAQTARRAMGVSRKKRSGHMDELAAAVILQSYLDAHRPSAGNNP